MILEVYRCVHPPGSEIEIPRWRIDPYAIVIGGNINDAADWEQLCVRHGVNCCISADQTPDGSSAVSPERLCRVFVEDAGAPYSTETLSCLRDSWHAWGADARPYIHCHMGRSRSPAFAYAWLRLCGLDRYQAVGLISANNPWGPYPYPGEFQSNYLGSIDAWLDGTR